MADAPAIAPAAPVAPAAPPAGAPAATPATPTGAAPTAPAMQRRLGQVEKKSYGTRPAQHSVPSAAAPATVTASATAEGSATSAPSAEATKPDPAAPPVETAPAEKPEAKVTDAEEARRLARINRAESKLATERRAFAEERAQHAQVLQRVKVIEQAAGLAKSNPLAFMRQAFGVEPQAILDSIVAEGAKPEATRVQEQRAQEASELQRKIAQLEKTVQTAAEAQKQEAHARDVAAYKSSAIAPILADASKYELTTRVLGKAAVEEVFALQEKRFQITAREVQAGRRQAPEVLTPGQAADIIEKHLRSQRDALNGTSVAPAKPQPSARIEPAPAQTSGSQTQNQANGRFRVLPKPYTTKLVR